MKFHLNSKSKKKRKRTKRMEEEGERVIRALDERLEKHDDNRRVVQE